MTSTTTSTRPTSVTAAFIIWLVTVLLNIVDGITLFVLSGTAAVAGASTTSSGVGTAVYVTAAVVAIVIAVIELFVVFSMRKGRNWARIVLTVLAVLQVVAAITGTRTGGVFGWIGVAAVVVATVLMFVRASNAYFRSSRTI